MVNRFVILGTQRTGSGALASALRLHPNIFCGWEWTQNSLPWNSVRIADEALRSRFNNLSARNQRDVSEICQRSVRQIGFKKLFRCSDKWWIHPRFSPTVPLDALYSHIRWLQRDPEIKVIHLTRADNLEWLKSKYLSRMTGNYHDGHYGQVVVKIPLNAAIKRVIAKNWLDNELSSLDSGDRYMRVFYEDFLTDPQEATRVIVDFLGEDKHLVPELKGRLRKTRQSNKQIEEYIENFHDVASTLELRGLRFSV